MAAQRLPAHLVDERLAWWNARPRTAAWAERYGGGFDRVVRLLETSQWRQRAKRWSFAVAFVGCLGPCGPDGLALAERQASEAQAERAERTRWSRGRPTKAARPRSNATSTFGGPAGRFVNNGTLSAKNAEQLLEDAQDVRWRALQRTRTSRSDISEIEIVLLLSFSDVRDALGDRDDALKRAERALAIAEAIDQAVSRQSGRDAPHFRGALSHWRPESRDKRNSKPPGTTQSRSTMPRSGQRSIPATAAPARHRVHPQQTRRHSTT